MRARNMNEYETGGKMQGDHAGKMQQMFDDGHKKSQNARQ